MSLVWGPAISAFGILMLIDAVGWVEVSAGWYGAAVCVLLGLILCASGLGARRD